jgi:hypothetical protein
MLPDPFSAISTWLEAISEEAHARTSTFPASVIKCMHGRFQPSRFLRIPRTIDPFARPGDTHCPATRDPTSDNTFQIEAKQEWSSMWLHFPLMRSAG